MKITRYQNESICINHQMTVTLHDQTAKRCCLFIQDHLNEDSYFKVLDQHDELVISHFNTTLIPISFDRDGAGKISTTFAINHDPNVTIHRSENGELH